MYTMVIRWLLTCEFVHSITNNFQSFDWRTTLWNTIKLINALKIGQFIHQKKKIWMIDIDKVSGWQRARDRSVFNQSSSMFHQTKCVWYRCKYIYMTKCNQRRSKTYNSYYGFENALSWPKLTTWNAHWENPTK